MQNSKKYSWLFFDADGTLFDFDNSQEEALKKTFLNLSIPFMEIYNHIYTEINTKLWSDLEKGKTSVNDVKKIRFKKLFNKINVNSDYITASSLYLKYLSEGNKLISGAYNTILKLKNTYNLLLITNGLSSVQKPRFAQSAIVKHFRAIIISEEVGHSKPQPEIFDLSFKKAGNPAKKEVLMIGDGLGSDISGGINYGIDTCWCNFKNQLNTNNFHPTYTINSINQILDILGE